MMSNFQRLEPEDAQTQQFDTSKPVYAYIRFSTLGQVKSSKQSKIMQDTRMEEKLVRLGFTDIRKKDKDEGMSAQKGTDQRTDLADIYSAMKKGQCGAIAAWDASRLWRDRDRVFYNEFILMLKKHNVPVILNNKTYWPKVKSDMEALRVEFEYSQKALEQMYDKANPARQEAILSGSYGGHAVPMGFVLVGEKGDKRYAIYEPHAKLIIWIFNRYQQLSGNLGKLGRELVAMDFHFPDFDKDILRKMEATIPHVALTHDSKGYKLQSRNGLISVLTNRAYLGWYVYEARSEESKVFKGEWINKEAHKNIVEVEDFLYAYARLSPVTLDGEPNENKPAVNRSYGGVNALLEGILASNGAPCYAMRSGSYVARLNNDGWKSAELVAKIAEVDGVFSRAMIMSLARLELGKGSKELAAKVKTLQAEQEEKVETLTGTLTNVDKAIRQWELAKSAALEAEYQPDVVEAMRHLKRLRAQREAVEQKANKATSEAGKLAECGDLLDCAKRDWHGMGFGKQQRLVRLLVGHANIEEVAPHILRLTVALIEPVGMVLNCYMWRQRGSKPAWTEKENDALRKLYAGADRANILEALPTRTWDSILMQATNVLGLQRMSRVNTSGIKNSSTLVDEKLIEKLGNPSWPYWTIDTNIQEVNQLVHQ